MRKMLLPVLLILTMVLSACGKEAPAPQENAAAAGNETKTETKTGTVTYQSENGPIEIPADPKRIIGLTNAPNILSLDGKLVGVDQWTKESSFQGQTGRCRNRLRGRSGENHRVEARPYHRWLHHEKFG